jgi:hypothetical protein
MLAERQGAGIGGVGPWLVLRRRSFADAALCCGVSAGAGCKACRVRDFVTLSGVTGTVAVMRTGKLASSGDRAETVLLTGCCERRRHVMYQVLNTPTGLVVDAPLRAVGRKRATWTPQRRELADGSAVRYGCGCGRTSLVPDSVLLAGIRRGDTIILETAYTI